MISIVLTRNLYISLSISMMPRPLDVFISPSFLHTKLHTRRNALLELLAVELNQ